MLSLVYLTRIKLIQNIKPYKVMQKNNSTKMELSEQEKLFVARHLDSLLTILQSSERLKMSPRTLHRICQSGRGSSKNIKSLRLITSHFLPATE